MAGEESFSMSPLAGPTSLLGMLQRGRGKGYLAALEKPAEEVWPLLFECITNDPRLDRQCEHRQEYYASLVAATQMNLDPLAAYLRENDSRSDDYSCWLGLSLETVECLARQWRDRRAMEILRDYVSFGRGWRPAVMALSKIDMPGAMEGVDEVLVKRISGDPDVRAQFEKTAAEEWRRYCDGGTFLWGPLLPFCEPWKTLCEKNPRLARLFTDLGIAYDQPPPPRKKMTDAEARQLSLAEAFAVVDQDSWGALWRTLSEKVSPQDEEFFLNHMSSDDKYRVTLALRGLGQLGTPAAFEAVKSYIEAGENADQHVRARAFRVLMGMPGELTLDTARAWFRRKEWHLHAPAGSILEQHATPDDVPMLIDALRSPEAIQCGDCRLSSALQSFWRFDAIGAIPELETVFCETIDCYCRYDAAAVMKVTAPAHFEQHYAFECLWDCHANTRELACDTVSLTIPGARDRLAELADDEHEPNDVRQTAGERIRGS